MNVSKQSSFYHNADAVALGGHLTQPLERIISTPASVALAAAGGFSTSHIEAFHVDHIISAGVAHVHVSGSEHKDQGVWKTNATASVERLNIFEVITADRIVSQVSITHHKDVSIPATISLVGTHFVNLHINGKPALPILDPRCFAARGSAQPREEEEEDEDSCSVSTSGPPTFTDLLVLAEAQYDKASARRKRFSDIMGTRFSVGDPGRDLDEKGSVLCSIVQKVEVEAPAVACGHVIHVPDFGNIFLGELLVNRFSAQLTMLRIEMGCSATGTVTAGTARGNGRLMP